MLTNLTFNIICIFRSTRSTRSSINKISKEPPTKTQTTMKKFLLNTKKPIRTAEFDEDVEIVRTKAEAPTEHYVLTEFKNDEEEENEINFILTDNFNVDQPGPVAECTEEIQIEEEGDENDDMDDEDVDAMVVRTQEIVEHVCGKCFKTFRTVKVKFLLQSNKENIY